MRRLGLLALIAVTVAVALGSTRWALLAQEPKSAKSENLGRGRVTIEEAMARPFTFPFAEDTTLDAVAKHLQKALGAPVVLDVAALKRRELTADSTVKLDLKDVRLKTGLKLLLDQVGLTYKIVPEDNLLVLTDLDGTEDVPTRVLAELKSLHREVHELIDAVDELNRSIVPVEEAGPALRKPTIIEDMPDEKGKPKPEEPPARSRPGF